MCQVIQGKKERDDNDEKIKNAITAFGLAFSLLLTGCASAPAASGTSAGGAEGEPVTIRFMWWGSQTRHDQTIQMIEMFMEISFMVVT